MNLTKGSCHCNSIKWEFSFPIKTVVKCHCANCRKLQGSEFSTWIVVPRSQFKITLGQDKLSIYQASVLSKKSFCACCGSTVYCVNEKHFIDHFVLPLGAVDNYTKALAPQIQVYTQDKAEWVTLHDLT